ncbi:MAG: hypothetical protein WCB96_12710 [Candidatus Aminicenantales bacterium]|jgi:hypothetical protein
MNKRFITVFLVVALLGMQTLALTGSVVIKRRLPHRTVVVVHRGFPIVRPLRPVIVHPIIRPYRIAPRLFLPLVFWTGVVVAATSVPAPQFFVWEDGENLLAQEGWTEFTLNCENTGTKLWLEIVKGRVRLDWAEVVFGNGETQVMDMKEFVRDPGYYLLLDFANGREVDHVRMVAQAETPEARLVLRIQK